VTPLVMVMRSVTSVTPFCYGYAVSHSEPSAQIPLMGYIFFVYIVYGYGNRH